MVNQQTLFNSCIKTKEAQVMLNENIKNLRKAKGLSQEELAIKLNVVRQRYRNGKKGIHLDKDTTPFPR